MGTALIGQVNLFLERETEGVQKGLGLLIGVGGGHESDVHTTLVIDGVEVDLPVVTALALGRNGRVKVLRVRRLRAVAAGSRGP